MSIKFLSASVCALLTVCFSMTAFSVETNYDLSSQHASTKFRPIHIQKASLTDNPKTDAHQPHNLPTDGGQNHNAQPDITQINNNHSEIEKTPKTTSKAEAPSEPEPVEPTLIARINLTTQRMTVSSNGDILYKWRISSGRRGYETPPGTFQPSWMARRWRSRQYHGAPMPYAVFFNRGIATHGTGAVRRLGRPASHGCIRLRTANARKFYKLVQSHGKSRTQIVVTGRAKQRRNKQTNKRRYSHNPRSNIRRTAKRHEEKKDLYARAHFRNAFFKQLKFTLPKIAT